MRSYETAAQILLITSIVSSTLATPVPAPEVHVERALTSAELKPILKTGALTGLIGGAITASGTLLQKLFIHDYINNSTSVSRRSPVARGPLFPLEDLTSRQHQQASRGLAGLSDKDLRVLSVIARRAIEDLD